MATITTKPFKMKKITLLMALAIGILSSTAFAQGYSSSGGTSAGIRLGPDAGITVKHHTGKAALEGILHVSNWYTGFTGLYHFFHQPVGADLRGLDWYAGAGGHIWGYRRDSRNLPGWYENGTRTGFGVDFALGLQYNFPSAPLNMALDWKPAINLVGGSGWAYSSVGLSIRYRWR